MKTLKSLLPGLLMMMISLIVLSQAIGMDDTSILDPASGSFFPAIVGLIMFVTGGVTFLQERRSTPSDGNTETEGTNDPDVASTTNTFDKKDYQLVLLYYCLVIGFVVILPIISFFPAAFLFLVTSIFFLKGVSWRINLLVSLGAIFVIYFLFSELFNIVFP
ncbi:hypothetical protein HNR44_002503 [Geomicrobium halophilum]|uniref:DUF1468 domain-containing protein n=1 Tax=Geomicrobium halophilum TaxID=549000 RepID=A0A841PP24_9BACL|nr:tripartite tricarboxylate transporter TctB family protein [Geomicrobium halophilum]MBB6450520.1 hypothetical protein [Geomicrobium halophilum]